MAVTNLTLRNFRNHSGTQLELHPALTLLEAPNGHGKTNLLEAVDLLAGGRSFRRAHPADLVGPDGDRATVAAAIVEGARHSDVRLEVTATGVRAQLNGKSLRPIGNLAGVLRSVVFTPADLALVQAGAAQRRRFLDDVLLATSSDYRAAHDALARVLRQRARLLTQAGPRPESDLLHTLDVWDDQLADAGERVGRARAALAGQLQPVVEAFYERVAGQPVAVGLEYQSEWMADGLASALAAARAADLRSGRNSVGPQRDELAISIDALAARTHRSQGEQRSMALALRLAQCRHVTEATGSDVVVLLDDVFSELDEGRASRLVGCLPDGQTVLTSATGSLPEGIALGAHVVLRDGAIVSSSVLG